VGKSSDREEFACILPAGGVSKIIAVKKIQKFLKKLYFHIIINPES